MQTTGTLTFNISVGKHKLPTAFPYQIIPNARAYINPLHLKTYSGGSKDTVIHVGYPINPFLESSIMPYSKIWEQLWLYKHLASTINAGYILIHLPKSPVEMKWYKAGLNLIIKRILTNEPDDAQWDGIVLLEIEPFTKAMYAWLEEKYNAKTFKEIVDVYFDRILSPLPFAKGRIKITFDTAHMFSIGCKSLDDFKYLQNKCKEHLSDVIHLNGNVAGIRESDEHIPFFVTTSQNKMATAYGEEDYNNMIKHVFETFRIVISENNFTKYPLYDYKAYHDWAVKNNVKIIPNPDAGKYTLV